MNAFDDALKRFKRHGCFIYQDACLNVERLEKLKASLVEVVNLAQSNPYQFHFHLNNVRLDPQTNQVAPLLRRQSTRTSRSNSSSSSEGASGSSDFAERIAAFEQFNEEQKEAEFTLSRNEFATKLLSVLKSGIAWSSIKIEGVYFQQGPEEKDYLRASFHRPLLSHLTWHDSLRTLSLEPFFLSEGGVLLGNFLTDNVHLQDLSLGITAGKLIDWENLGLKLAAHHGLTQANFQNTALNNASCSGLIALTRNNYKTKIIIPVLQRLDERKLHINLCEEYQALIKRLQATPEQRFIDERLSEASILDLVTSTLVKISAVQKITNNASLRDSVGPKAKLAEGAVRAIGQLIDATVNEAQSFERRSERNQSEGSRRNQEKKALKLFAYLIGAQDPKTILHSEESFQVLPKVYQDNREYLENKLSSLKLNLNSRHPGKNQSIAVFLLDKVYQIGNAKALQLLLDAKVNVFEPVMGAQDAFLVKAFKNNDQNMKPFRQALLEHIIQDDKAMGEIEKQLEAYPDLLIPYQSLIKHLDHYAGILQQREKESVINQLIAVLKSGLVFIWKEDTAAKRPEEFAGIKYHLEQSIQSITSNGDAKPGNNEFHTARKCFERMMEISEKAKKGRFWTSNLHDGVVFYSKQLIAQLHVIQNQLINQYKGKADEYKEKYEAVTEEQTELKEKLSQTELRCKEKVSKITREMQAQQARVQAEQARVQADQARVQADQARVQAEQARVQAERAEIEARVEARVQAEQAEMRKRIQELESLFRARMGLPDNEATEPAPETAGSSAQFFSGPR